MKRMPLNILLILLLGSTLMLSCDKGDENNPDPVSIEYILTADEPGTVADIEYTSGFGLIRLENVTLPWSMSFKAIFQIGDALNLKAESGEQSTMSAQILVDDELVTSGSATHLLQLSYIKGLK